MEQRACFVPAGRRRQHLRPHVAGHPAGPEGTRPSACVHRGPGPLGERCASAPVSVCREPRPHARRRRPVHGRWDSCTVLCREIARLKCFQQVSVKARPCRPSVARQTVAPGFRNLARIGRSIPEAEHKRHAGQRPCRHGQRSGFHRPGPCRNRILCRVSNGNAQE